MLFGTIAAVVRLDAAALASVAPGWERFWRVYHGWMGHPDPARPLARYALVLTLSTTTLYAIGYFAAANVDVLGAVLSFVIARIATAVGMFLAWPGMGYGIASSFTVGAHPRPMLRLLVLVPAFLLSFWLLFLHPAGFGGAWVSFDLLRSLIS